MKTQLYLGAALVAVLSLSACETAGDNVAQSTSQSAVVSGFTKVETITKKSDELVIPYTKYVLDNGLTLVLHPDKSDPLVHVDITYHVGSGREDVGKSGFAHFFEHMMFQGSENVADEQHFGLITESGGTLNGTTNSDRTNYFETVPSNQLERMLWLESDRMGFFLDAVTEAKFENQRETVKNERGQRVDNAPYGLLGERVGEAMYPEGHPYSWSVIGYIEDLDRADLNDLKKFFLRWYGPNNATLTIGGDFDEQQTLEWVKQYFGGIPTGPAVGKPAYTPVSLDADRYISLEDNVALPLMFMSFPTVHANHPDEAPLDVLQSILGVGQTSLLYKNLVKDGLAVQASAGHRCAEINCTFTLLALPTPGNSLADMEKVARASLVEFEERGGANDDDLIRVKASIVSGMIYGLESVSGKIRQLAAYQTYRNNPNGIKDDVARYENVSKADVMRVYKKYIKDQHAVIMSIVPKGKGDTIIKADTWQRYERDIPQSSKVTELELRPGTSNFDRSIIPAPGPNPTITLPGIYKAEGANGMKILGSINDEVPTTTILIRMHAGQIFESLDQLGLASLTAALMGQDTQTRTAEELSNALQKLGSRVTFNAGDQYTTINIRTLTENLSETLAIAKERLATPKFTQKDFDRLQKQTIAGLENAKKNAGVTATNVFTKLLFGEDNGFAHADAGTIETVKALTLADVESFYNNTYGSKGADIIVVSDLPAEKISKKLAIFDDWTGSSATPLPLKSFPDIAARTLYFIDKPDAAQSEIRIGKRALKFDATGEYYRVGLMNYNLGGAFNSRINLNLREDKGYSYGAFSFFYGNDLRGAFRAQAGVKSDTTTDSIRQFVKEISAFKQAGMTDTELSFMQNSLGQRDARSYETPGQKLGFLSQVATYDLSDTYINEQNAILSAISKDELNQLAAKHLNLDEMIIVVVGDKKVVMDDLRVLGFPIVELDTDGNPVK